MKKNLILMFTAMVFLLAGTSFKPVETSTILYPKLSAFFSSLDVKSIDKNRLPALGKLKDDFVASKQYVDETNIVFYCSENSFRSQASQVFAHTLSAENKLKKINVYSTGITATEVNPKLVEYLKTVGYKIVETDKAGRKVYEVFFSDKKDPIILYSKDLKDKKLPDANITSIIVCDTEKEIECKKLEDVRQSIKLPFQKLNEVADTKQVESIVKEIATEILYVTKK